MRDDRRTVLKQLLSGRLTGKEAVAKLTVTKERYMSLIIGTSDGLHTYRGESGLTIEEVYARTTKGEWLMRVGEHQPGLVAALSSLDD